jgi:CHAT domain-containing protein/tetratricopeptide (TPR) repeat protein
MIPKYIRKFCILLIFSTTACLINASPYVSLSCPCCKNPEYIISISDLQKQPDSIQLLNARVSSLYATRNFQGLLYIADSLEKSLAVNYPDSITLAEIYYHIGVSLLLADKYNDALRWLNMCIKVKEDLGIVDNHYANGIFNIGVAYNYLGDFFRETDYMHRYIEISTRLYGYYSEEVAGAYTTLVSASLEKHEYDDVRNYANKTLEILNVNNNALQGSELCRFYINLGVWYGRLSDYAKARIYLEEAESIYNKYNIPKDQSYINLINSLAITYGSLGFTAKEKEYFDRGIELAVSSNSNIAYNLVYNYAIELGNAGMINMGEELISGLVDKSAKVFGYDSRFYIEALKNYAEYLRDYKHDYQHSIKYYLPCLDYLNHHNEEIELRYPVIAGYALSLSRSGEHIKALEKIQELLFFDIDPGIKHDKYENPDISKLKADSRTLRILRNKYEILWKIFAESDDRIVLENAAMTSELIISLLDKIRINISEDESRIILGDNYRNSYLFAIHDFELCYRNTGDSHFLEKVFEFTEKSKAAGLLAATRELNAVNFHIPSDISELEKSLQRDIAFYNSQISKENEKEMPDKRLISEWNDRLLKAVEVRDSLLLTYERDYPGYYAIKYGTDVLSMKDVPGIAGRNTNYLNYVVSDSLLYILLVNRKHKQILTFEIDSSFFIKLSDFRTLLSNSDISANARSKFDHYQRVAYDLYKILIEPVRDYFISDDLLISPDNILSYVPFETFISSYYKGEGIVYRRLPYLMNEFSISYIYSVSFMKETVGRDYRKTRNLIAFAPLYTKEIYIDSLSPKRQSAGEILYDIPYARVEAEYVTDISKGTAYMNEDARESVFKAEAGKYDIIHLAMHTYLNDQNPMASAMIFTQNNDLPEDGLLNTYEVYGIPLKARMVVLSSCNTGSGMLSSGEGILSLARGFLYSGSQSVVMSMWEIEDRSGTDIVKMYYDSLRRGKSKSQALKNARKEYLKTASQLKSHPYFWSSLIVYGDNSPIYHRGVLISVIVFSFCIILPVFYFLYRKYS